MPKETFNNLPAEKRELIEQCALSEFAENGYDAASINRIVSSAGIAKGSFYQYFEDKKDLFWLLIQRSAERKKTYLMPIMQHIDELDVFETFHELFVGGIKFATENPDGAKIGEWMMQNPNHEIYKTLIERVQPQANSFYFPLFENAKKKGEIREDLDIAFLSEMMTAMNTAMLSYYFKHHAAAKFEFEDSLIVYADKMIDIIKFGLKPKEVKEND